MSKKKIPTIVDKKKIDFFLGKAKKHIKAMVSHAKLLDKMGFDVVIDIKGDRAVENVIQSAIKTN